MHHVPPQEADDRKILQQMLGYHGGPAFVRRVKHLEDAERALFEHLGKKRTEALAMVRLRIGQLRALAGDWSVLRPLVASDAVLDGLRELHAELRPELRMPLEATRSRRTLRRALTELAEAIDAFNRRWAKVIAETNLAAISELREGYNKHYLLEKECALGDSRVARMGFKQLKPLTPADLLGQLPLLRAPAPET